MAKGHLPDHPIHTESYKKLRSSLETAFRKGNKAKKKKILEGSLQIINESKLPSAAKAKSKAKVTLPKIDF